MIARKESLKLHEKFKGKLEIRSKVALRTRKDLALAYTPGVAGPCEHIAKNKKNVYRYTFKGNTVAVVSDGSAVLGLGDIGAEAALPVMEGKALLFKKFANIDAFPICLSSRDVKKNIETIKNIAPVFGGINLEDFKAPECFEIEEALQNLGIPVMHDDQHGTAVVVLAGLINALKLTRRKIEKTQIIINGAGAAGIAVTKLLISYGAEYKNVFILDSKGVLSTERKDLNKYKYEIAQKTHTSKTHGSLETVLRDADVFIGVSKANLLTKEMVKAMNKDPIIFAMANPDPEILPDIAKKAGAAIVATGRSDFPNQVNNVLAFPGIFRGALDIRADRITEDMKRASAEALANCIKPSFKKILPNPLDKRVVPKIAEAVKKAWKK